LRNQHHNHLFMTFCLFNFTLSCCGTAGALPTHGRTLMKWTSLRGQSAYRDREHSSFLACRANARKKTPAETGLIVTHPSVWALWCILGNQHHRKPNLVPSIEKLLPCPQMTPQTKCLKNLTGYQKTCTFSKITFCFSV